MTVVQEWQSRRWSNEMKTDFSNPEYVNNFRENIASGFLEPASTRGSSNIMIQYDMHLIMQRNPEMSKHLAATIAPVIALNDDAIKNDPSAVSKITGGDIQLKQGQFLSTERSGELLAHTAKTLKSALQRDGKISPDEVDTLRTELAGKVSASDVITDKPGQIDDIGVQDLPNVAQQKAEIIR
jgi:hypothetical protein